MRNDLATLAQRDTQAFVNEKDKQCMVIVAARISGVQLKEITRRTGRNANLVAGWVKKYVNQAEKLRQQMRADAKLMKMCGFDAMFPPKAGDTRVDAQMLQQASPIIPSSRKKRRTTVPLRSNQPIRARPEPAPHTLEDIGAKPILPLRRQHDDKTMQQSVLACATYVLSQLKA